MSSEARGLIQGGRPSKLHTVVRNLGVSQCAPRSKEIEAAFDIDAVDSYGLSELLGPGVATECIEAKGQLYIWEDHFYPEVIDPNSGTVLADGEYGELVLTS